LFIFCRKPREECSRAGAVSFSSVACIVKKNQVLAFTPSFNNYEITVVCSGSVGTNSGEGMSSQIHLASLFAVYPL